jgi:hypothetical protein
VTVLGESGDEREAPDALVLPRGVLGCTMVAGGAVLLGWSFKLVYDFVIRGLEPALESRLAARVLENPDPLDPALAHLGCALLALLGLVALAWIGAMFVRAGVSLLQPDWRHLARRFEAAWAARTQR